VRADILLFGKGVVGSAFRAIAGDRIVRVFDTKTAPITDAELDAFARSSACPIVVDATAADGFERVYARALARRIHVVTANKKPLVAPWHVRQELFALADANGVTIGREATVGAGLPILSTLGDLLATGDRVRRIEAVLSGTLSFLCDELDRRKPLHAAVATAKALGYTEPDPREDLSGKDVARKAVILARELGYPAELADVALSPFEPHDEYGTHERLVYVARIAPRRGRPHISAQLEVRSRDDVVASVKGPVALVAFTTDRYREEPLVVRGPGAGGAVTASAVLGDVLRAEARATGTPRAGIQAACAARFASVVSSASRSESIPAGF